MVCGLLHDDVAAAGLELHLTCLVEADLAQARLDALLAIRKKLAAALSRQPSVAVPPGDIRDAKSEPIPRPCFRRTAK